MAKNIDTAIFYSPIFLKHFAPSPHPENPNRLKVILKTLEKSEIADKIPIIKPMPATKEQVYLNHSPALVKEIEKLSNSRGTYLDPDTYINEYSYKAAMLAAGSGIQAVDMIAQNSLKKAFCLVRPPGHHAEFDKAMGFCLFNNAAICAHYSLTKGFERILILDFDAHHGNGTQRSFYDTDKVFYISLHQWPLYPGTGSSDETGTGIGIGYNLNFPLPASSGDEIYNKIFVEKINPLMDNYKPQLVIISGGFDSHINDPLANLSLTKIGYQNIANHLKNISKKHNNEKLIFFLEGGYNLETLVESFVEFVKVIV